MLLTCFGLLFVFFAFSLVFLHILGNLLDDALVIPLVIKVNSLHPLAIFIEDEVLDSLGI
jgi:hypothetical protein